jgi:hypothetical protein
MTPLDLIPVQYRIAAELLLTVVFAVACATFGALVMHWHDGTELANTKAAWSQEQAKALKSAVDERDAAIKTRDQLATKLSGIDRDGIENLRRFEHANQALAAGADAGTVRVRVVGAACPAAHDVPQATTGGSVDSGAGAELGADARRRYFALRGAIGDAQAQLAACQRSLGCLTGQGACPAPDSAK